MCSLSSLADESKTGVNSGYLWASCQTASPSVLRSRIDVERGCANELSSQLPAPKTLQTLNQIFASVQDTRDYPVSELSISRLLRETPNAKRIQYAAHRLTSCSSVPDLCHSERAAGRVAARKIFRCYFVGHVYERHGGRERVWTVPGRKRCQLANWVCGRERTTKPVAHCAHGTAHILTHGVLNLICQGPRFHGNALLSRQQLAVTAQDVVRDTLNLDTRGRSS